MKKIIALFLTLVIAFTLYGCKSKDYKEIEVTVTDEAGNQVTQSDGKAVTEKIKIVEKEVGVPVTDASGTHVTDDAGNVVTEKIMVTQQAENSSSKSQASNGDASTSKASSTQKNSNDKESTSGSFTPVKNENKTTKVTTQKATTKPATTTKPTTTKPTTTKKPATTAKPTTTSSKKRNINLQIDVLTQNGMESAVIVEYKVEGEKEYKQLKIEDNKIVLNKNQTLNYVIEKVKGAVDIRVLFEGVYATDNTASVASSDRDQTVIIRPVTGIEVLQAEDLD